MYLHKKLGWLIKGMSVTTVTFLLFMIITTALYYIVSKEFKWKILLLASILFSAISDIRGILFIVLTSVSIWWSALHMADDEKRNKRLLIVTMLFNFGILVFLKYLTPFMNGILPDDGKINLLVPIGISYYTLQAVSYILDVYWERTSPEKNYFKVLLFVCYFPQMLQGPINRYGDLSKEIYDNDHSFNIDNIKFGVQLMLWGYFKSMVISEYMAGYVHNIFYTDTPAYGLTVFGGLALFGIQLYANFSGGIDIVRGASKCFGIELPDNFRQPYFSKSLGEFWRRWHMTLGSWMKDYAFYPFSMSPMVSKMKKKLKKHVSRRMANRIPIAISNIVIFLVVGVWHGFGTNFAIWGLYNGIILCITELLTDRFVKIKSKFKINEESKVWGAFCIVRTFVIVTIGRCTDCAPSASGALRLIRNMLFVGASDLSMLNIGIGGIARIAVLLIVGILHEKGISIREELNKKNILVQIIFWIIVIQSLGCFGTIGKGGGFIYADF